MSERHRADPVRLQHDLRGLTRGIGVRLAGTAGERAAAELIASGFRDAGAEVDIETFPIMSRDFARQQLTARIDGQWIDFACSPLTHSLSTNGQVVEAPLMVFEAPADYGRDDLSYLTGAAVMHLGTHIASRAQYRRLIESEPAMLLFVDTRYPGHTPLADSLFPAYRQAVGAAPSVNVAYHDAWRWVTARADAVRLRIDGQMRPSESTNVVAQLPAADANAPVILLGAHHDTQADSVGADDNASGVIGLLELARLLAESPRRRTVRLISFGTEEQLSVGSACYTRRHADALRARAQFMLNLDSYASPMGWTRIMSAGPPAMASFLRDSFAAQGLHAQWSSNVTPFVDHFPFAQLGIPSASIVRENCTAGRFYHHRPDDDESKVDLDLVAAWISGCAAMFDELATCDDLPFASAIPAADRERIEALWQDLFAA